MKAKRMIKKILGIIFSCIGVCAFSSVTQEVINNLFLENPEPMSNFIPTILISFFCAFIGSIFIVGEIFYEDSEDN